MTRTTFTPAGWWQRPGTLTLFWFTARKPWWVRISTQEAQ